MKFNDYVTVTLFARHSSTTSMDWLISMSKIYECKQNRTKLGPHIKIIEVIFHNLGPRFQISLVLRSDFYSTSKCKM